MFVPNEFSRTSFGLGSCCDVVLETITVDVNPKSDVVEEAILLLGYLVHTLLLCDVDRVSSDHIYVAVGLARGKEPIRHHNGADSRPEDVPRHQVNTVGPAERVSYGNSFEVVEFLSLDCGGDVRDHFDLSAYEGSERGNEQELGLVVELLYFNKSWARCGNPAEIFVADFRGETGDR